MVDRTTRALDILTDLTLSPREALRRFVKISARWKPINRHFVLWIAEGLRRHCMEESFEECAAGRWADDGGPA